MKKIAGNEKKQIFIKLILLLKSDDEKQFKKQIKKDLDDIVKFKGIYELLSDMGISFSINNLDKYLDREDPAWYSKAKKYFPPLIVILEDLLDDLENLGD